MPVQYMYKFIKLWVSATVGYFCDWFALICYMLEFLVLDIVGTENDDAIFHGHFYCKTLWLSKFEAVPIRLIVIIPHWILWFFISSS